MSLNEEARLLALGRYTDACDRATAANSIRYRALMEIKRAVNGDCPPEDIKRIDFDSLASLVETARKADADLRNAFDSANSVAADIGKPRLDFKR